jgi:Bardet-Biedl syndrome 1 protein
MSDPWISAFHDPVAGLRVFSPSLRLVDLAGDGDHRLVAANLDKRLKVFRGTGVSSVHPLLDQPVAAAVFFPDSAVPRTPSIAVAAGSFIYIYRNLRPYLKFSLPHVKLSAAELEAAALLSGTAIGSAAGAAAGTAAGTPAGTQAGAQAGAPVGAFAGAPPVAPRKATVVTCMETIARSRDGEGEPSSLVVGTEAMQVLFLDASGAAVERTPVELPSVPALIVVHGTLQGEHRISVACRDGVVYAIKDRELTATRIEPPAAALALARTDALLYVASIDSKVTAYQPKGKKAFTLPMPAPVTAMVRMLVKRDRTSDCVAVALEGGEVRVYNGSALVASLQTADTVVAMRFGQYGREANTLVLVGRAGSLTFKMLKRTASFEPPSLAPGAATLAPASAGAPEQDMPLAVPKKTRLYLEQTQRERDSSGEMYRVFQRDLVRLRLSTARAYAKVLSDGLASSSDGASPRSGGASGSAAAGGAQLRANCSVRGLGPRFKVSLDLHCASGDGAAGPSLLLFNVAVAFIYSPAIYYMEKPLVLLPLVMPGVHYMPEVDITCIEPTGAADIVKVVITAGNGGGVPALTVLLSMPLSQV